MAIQTYLAMTGAEFQSCEAVPEHIAWMACHFSPGDSGLCNLPAYLPPGSLLILDDQLPITGHDPQRIAQQLRQAATELQCGGVLLDFQRPDTEALRQLIPHLLQALPCPVAVSDLYARDFDCPVFLSPCPHHVPLSNYILPWADREVWLDLASNAETILLSKSRCQITPLPLGELPDGGHAETLLHCHYLVKTSTESAEFTLWRTRDDRKNLLAEADALGIRRAVCLFLEGEV